MADYSCGAGSQQDEPVSLETQATAGDAWVSALLPNTWYHVTGMVVEMFFSASEKSRKDNKVLL